MVVWLSRGYLAILLGVWLLLLTASDAWWPATLLMFLPRWIWWMPLLPLGLAAACLRPGQLEGLLVGALFVLGPLMGLCVPWQRVFADGADDFHCRVLTCNVHRNLKGLQTALAENKPEIVVLQDCPSGVDAQFFGGAGWHVRTTGQFCLASRFPIREFTALENPSAPDAAALAILETPVGPVRIYNLHLATPRQALSAVRQRGWNGASELEANSEMRRTQSTVIRAWIDQTTGPSLAAGDFNTPPDSALYRQRWSDLTNAFSQAGLGWGYTYHMNRTALRIDHILAGPGWTCRRCWVGPDVGSEHFPVIADLAWRKAQP
jgi:endonuclease/exonuclease/phosphatase family metal-dependent hydrolase